jgi:hypothetical protein
MKKEVLALFFYFFTPMPRNGSSLSAERFLYGCENLEGIALENCFMIKYKILFSKNVCA